MGKHVFTFSIIAVAALAIIALSTEPALAAANNTGSGLLSDIEGLIAGKLGTVLGLGVSLFGLWVWLAQQSSWGLLILIAGAALTAFPGLYGSLASAFENAFESTGAGERVKK